MTEIIKNIFDEVMGRIKENTPVKNQEQLAEIAGITQAGISKARKRNEFSAEWAYKVGKKYNLTTEWIMTGQGQKRPGENIERKYEILDEAEEWLNEEVRKNPDRKIWFEVELLDAFPKFMEWRRKRAEEKDSEDEYPASKVA